MKRKGPRKTRAGDPNDPRGLRVRLDEYAAAMRVRNFSERTLDHRVRNVDAFIAWCETRSVTRPEQVTKPVIEAYQRHLFHRRKPNGAALSFASQLQQLVSVKMFFKWLARSNLLLWNPASDIEMPRVPRRLPRHVLTVDEAERVLEGPDLSDAVGIRDRAILETLYSTGIRRMELIGLDVTDVDAERGTMLVRLGKGQKDRVVPIGERASAWIERYKREARGQLVFPPDPGALFLTQLGERLDRGWLSQRVRDYVARAEIGKTGACHLFRHTCATLMLEGGADVRYIQEMLGHANVSTTQIYTQVSIRRLKAVHTLTHPGAKVDRGEGAFPPLAAAPEAADELRAALEQEPDDEDDGGDGDPS
jgi:integrase/recombinase XerD